MTLNEIAVAFDAWYKQNKYSGHTIKNDKSIRDRILLSHTKLGETLYSPKVTADFLRKYEKIAVRRGFSRKGIVRVRKIASLLDEYYETGTFVWKLNKANNSTLSAHYTDLLSSYIAYEEKLAKRTSGTIANFSRVLQTFLKYLQDHGCADLSSLTHKMVADYIVYISKPRPKSVAYNCYTLRVFADFIASENMECINIRDATPSIPKRGRRIMPAFTAEDVNDILAAQDRSTAIGKRDFAMFAIASSTGLRACDIVKLRRTDIDWKKHHIYVRPTKSDSVSHVPIKNYVGNAIADYILNGRPDSDSPYIFLKARSPFSPLKRGALLHRLSICITQKQPGDGKGTHAFRRYVATKMLEEGTSYDVIRDMLIHSHDNDLKSYIRSDSMGLKQCALDFSDITEEVTC